MKTNKTNPIRASRLPRRVLAGALGLLPTATAAWAQSSPAPAPVESSGGGLTVVLLLAALLAILVAAVRIVDTRRDRAAQAARLQARIADALLLDPMLAHVPITPTARLPLWRASPLTLEVAGPVPNPDLRAAALRLIVHEAASVRRDFRIEDRMAVGPATSRRAA
ncbi:MAG: hypothetical protein HYV93_14375 [Candidatus Rokubacteria bacterium]|nr:hypothetical protein [Candidatus Rokubacteria bacterium]